MPSPTAITTAQLSGLASKRNTRNDATNGDTTKAPVAAKIVKSTMAMEVIQMLSLPPNICAQLSGGLAQWG